MMALPVFSAPKLFTPTNLKSRPALVDDIIDLINDAFVRSKLPEPDKWEDPTRKRFPTRESYLEALGPDGIIFAIFDEDKIVPVAGAVLWEGGWRKKGAGVEEGWEVKAVAVHSDAKYLHQGLAVQLYAALEDISLNKKRTRSTQGCVTLWILAAECINGPYWRKRGAGGYREVRKETCGVGTWGLSKELGYVHAA
ncbi:hypothetical protein BU23DRAFT_545724 [Bimuria novae-zelandiae CBS 107.79]|uniref:N-acetyltransferase domain-containing protein n=1 Tax=Bimuria novae-zelandiae CBS 107.79 TaxID=1447943 RepID=A0A6A5UKV7_9PLEO|nr:hypothetical protein BU23DRAFT_545724 [Bimuria novae-zelandiae CBS 107.79]